MRTSEQINEIAKAMAAAQRKMVPAAKDGKNPHFRSSYASLTSVWEAVREPLTEQGLSVWQDVQAHENGVSVETRITHSSGQWVEFGPLVMPVSKPDAQGFGSCITYAKRYSLCAAVGVVAGDEDDDGNGACIPQNTTPTVAVDAKFRAEILAKIEKSLNGNTETLALILKHYDVKALNEIETKELPKILNKIQVKA